MKRKFTLPLMLAVCCLSVICLQTYAQNLVWAHAFGSSEASEHGRHIAVDAAGNMLLTGAFKGTVDFDPRTGPGDTANLRSAGETDIFIAKYDADGNYIWAKNISGPVSESSSAIAVDAVGNVYITGVLQGTVDFNPDPVATFNLTNTSSHNFGAWFDLFIAKYDTNGNFVWVKQLEVDPVANGTSSGVSLTVSATGALFVTGGFCGKVDFNPSGTATEYRTSATAYDPTNPFANLNDIFVARYDTAGNFVWVKTMGSTGSDIGNGIAVSSSGDVYVTGTFTGTVNFNPAGTANLAATGSDIFVARYDANGNYVWAKKMGATGSDAGTAIAVDAAGNAYVTGFFNGTATDFAGPGTVTLTHKGANDIFVARHHANGNFAWAIGIGVGGSSSSGDQGNGIAVDAAGNVYVTGYFSKGTGVNQLPVDFDPDPAGTAELTSVGGNDVFIARYDTSGRYIWAKNVGGAFVDQGRGIAVDAGGDMYVTGSFSGTDSIDFDPGPDSVKRVSKGGEDIFVLKFSCKSFTGFTETACDSFAFNGTTYRTSGIYKDTFANAALCDSIVTLDLTINPSHDIQIVQSACDSFSFHDTVYYATGVYSHLFTNEDGCDSTVTLDLTINPTPQASVTIADPVLTANSTDSYQWINCNGNTVITGATGQSYTAAADGSYAVVITTKGCTDTSDCVPVTKAGIHDAGAAGSISIYPNPAGNSITIASARFLHNATIRLVNLMGQPVAEQTKIHGNTYTLEIAALANGIYWVEVSEGNQSVRLKLVKK